MEHFGTDWTVFEFHGAAFQLAGRAVERSGTNEDACAMSRMHALLTGEADGTFSNGVQYFRHLAANARVQVPSAHLCTAANSRAA
jgi:hypothetical protein